MMDPQSLVFTPQNDIWRLSTALRSFQDIQQEHAERLVQIERRQDEDARLKSVWGPSSPFPGMLSGIPQQVNTSQGTNDDFTNFDDDRSSNMIRNLHIDTEEEPRRFVAASRANSVRFDESAKPGQWAHASRTSSEFVPSRTSSGLNGLGGHPLFERTTSHKSDGRHSSAGQSAVSGRANSFGIDTSQPLGRNSLGAPGLAPGLFILGSVPAIIRCWMNNEFTHDALLYAAVCTGSYKSFLDSKLVDRLGLSRLVSQDLNGTKRVKLPVYLPEAVPYPTSSQSSSPTPQLPTITIEFNVIEISEKYAHRRSIRIYIGSDVLRAHNADILFSSNSLSMFDDDYNKMSIPLVRPENDETFKYLRITNSSPYLSRRCVDSPELISEVDAAEAGPLTDIGKGRPQQDNEYTRSKKEFTPSNDLNDTFVDGHTATIISPNSTVTESSTHQHNEPLVGGQLSQSENQIGKEDANKDASNDRGPALSTPSQAIPNPTAAESNWHRESGSFTFTGDWANASRSASGTHQRPSRDHGIKILKPARQAFKSSTNMRTASPVSATLRFFEDGKRGSGLPGIADNTEAKLDLKRSVSNDSSKLTHRENVAISTGPTKQPRGANPIGGASAFGWLNPPPPR